MNSAYSAYTSLRAEMKCREEALRLLRIDGSGDGIGVINKYASAPGHETEPKHAALDVIKTYHHQQNDNS